MTWTLRHCRAFTMVEILMVIVIIVLACSMLMSYNGRGDRRGLQVRAQAEQLASVMRKTRALAMDQKATFGVAFNIANAPGSSGRILNNRSGGHYYRICGPDQHNGQMDWSGSGNGYSSPYLILRDVYGNLNTHDWAMSWSLGETAYDWASPKYVLPQGEVRFLALTDEDNGNLVDCNWTFGPTYPRPWFGAWDANTHQLNAWGGYDPTLLDFQKPQNVSGDPDEYQARTGAGGTISYTGFYYEGADGHLSGCLNPKDRYLYNDTNGTNGIDLGGVDGSGNPIPPDKKTFQLFKGGAVRPLVNADWLDCVIMFRPDGTAYFLDWLYLRHEFAKYSRARGQPSWYLFNDTFAHNLFDLAPADMCNMINVDDINREPYNNRYEASNFTARTGYYYITLAPDATDDRYLFTTAQQALNTLMPMYRVGVSTLGEVRVTEVHPVMPGNVSLDTTHADSWWDSGALGGTYFNNLLTTANGPAMPVEDFLTAPMLQHRQFWLANSP
jgi:type II secretory pathway pseudopilin PulG